MDAEKKVKKSIFKRWWFWVIVIIIVIAAIPKGDTNTPKNNDASGAGSSGTVQKKEEAKDIPYEAQFTSGHYTAGVDFPSGTYDITAVAGGGNVSSSNMYSGGINAVMGVEANDMYEKEYKNVKLPDGESLSVSGLTVKIVSEKASGKALTPRSQTITEAVNLGSGHFVAGTDFPVGVYNIIATSGSGNVSSSNMYSGGLNAIMGVEENALYIKEFKNVNLSDAVTLSISGVKVQLVPSK